MQVDFPALANLQEAYVALCEFCVGHLRAGDAGAQNGTCADMAICGTGLCCIQSKAELLDLLAGRPPEALVVGHYPPTGHDAHHVTFMEVRHDASSACHYP